VGARCERPSPIVLIWQSNSDPKLLQPYSDMSNTSFCGTCRMEGFKETENFECELSRPQYKQITRRISKKGWFRVPPIRFT